MRPTFKFKNDDSKVQHAGFGKRLMKKAEEIAISQGYKKIVVISGIGVKNYYRKLGYKSKGTFMVKKFKTFNLYLSFLVTIIISISLKIIINKIDFSNI
jgi:GNAT superfamily N-acetyltransferase